MQGINVQAIGALTKDPELKYFDNGKQKARFRIAVDRRFDRNKSDYLSCEAWGKTAEAIANNLKKGSLVGVAGRIEIQEWESGGEKKSAPMIICESVKFLSKPTTSDFDDDREF
jgi:single-strand DNA-binding protein